VLREAIPARELYKVPFLFERTGFGLAAVEKIAAAVGAPK
jgi:hypothetical protein